MGIKVRDGVGGRDLRGKTWELEMGIDLVGTRGRGLPEEQHAV